MSFHRIYSIYLNKILNICFMINQEISKIIKSRKSIYPKDFNKKQIDKKTIIEILENANHAPTHKMTQPWFFKVFSGKSKQKLLKEITSQNQEMTSMAKEKLNFNFEKTSHIICVCMNRNQGLLPEWEEIAATAMAVQNIWLSCVNVDIGGYWSTPKFTSTIKDFLSLSNTQRCLGFFYLGRHDFVNKRNVKRKNIEEETEWFV